MNKIRRKGKAEGSVLFTVVSVMMVMVVFLMSTLVLTTSANRRTYYTFYQNQAQYTAQGVLDAISNSAYSNADFSAWINEIDVGEEAFINVDVSQLKSDDTHLRIPLTDGSEVIAKVEKIAHNYIWDRDSAAIHEQGGWKITVTASVGQGRNASEYTMANYIYANPEVEVGTGEFNMADWTEFGGLNVKQGGSHTTHPGDASANKAKAMFLGATTNGSVSNNLLCLGPQTYGTRSLPAGRGNYANQGTVAFTNDSPTVGNSIFIGNFDCNCKKTYVAQTAGEGVQFWGDFYAQNMFEMFADLNVEPTEYRYIPYLYVDGNLHFNQDTGQEIGMHGFPVNIYTNQMTNAPQNMTGDIYMYNPEVDSTYNHARATNLHYFIASNIQKTNYSNRGYVGGDIISTNNSLTISGNVTYINGDVIMANPNGTLIINALSGRLDIRGAILCAGDLVINCGDKPLEVLGGIYADPARTSITGNVNGVTTGSLAEICDATIGLDAYLTAFPDPQATEPNTNIYYQNTSTEAKFESLGGRGATGATYEELIKNLKAANLGAQDGNTYYIYENKSGYDFSMFPFCSRQDEIFTHYFRFDLAAADANTANANLMNDALVQESMACGHEWAITIKAAASGNLYVPYTVPKGASVTSLEPSTIMTQSANCFISMLETSSGSPLASNEYINSYDAFVSQGNVTESYNIANLPKKAVKFTSHLANGQAETVDLGTVPVVTENCEIDLTNNNQRYTLFIDPTQRSNALQPLYIVLKGRFMNEPLEIVVNNNCNYEVGPGGANYEKYTTYAQLSHDNQKPIFAGRSDVVIFFDQSIFATKDFMLTTTGAYAQFKTGVYDIISNPIYPGTLDANNQMVINGTWDNMYASGNKDAFKFELVPNVVIYGEAGVDYNGKFQNGFISNAELIMPDSDFGTPVSVQNVQQGQLFYREFTESNPYNPYTDNSYPINASGMMSMGTIMIRDWTGYANLPICTYLGDLNRPGSISEDKPDVGYSSNNSSSSSSATVSNNKDLFANDHQGMR